jgi:integrase
MFPEHLSHEGSDAEENYDRQLLRISQSIWRSHVHEPKTKKSRAEVPVISQLAARLDFHRARSGHPAKGLMFPTPVGRPINLDALVSDVIRPTLTAAKLEWHAFRRGLATNLHRLGVADKVIQVILRHANVSVTQRRTSRLRIRMQPKRCACWSVRSIMHPICTSRVLRRRR